MAVSATKHPGQVRLAVSLYSMATHGWGGIEYFEIFRKAIFFSPKLIIVAFYTGNDPAETFRLAYGDERWKRYRVQGGFTMADYPTAAWPPPENEQEFISFSDGSTRGFTPKVRRISNLRQPAVDAAYDMMGKIADEMGAIARKEKIKLIFTIIPTKELVHSRRVALEGITASEEFTALVRDENEQISRFTTRLSAIEGSAYVNLVADLQELALGGEPLYPSTSDGHPLAEGYASIARLLAPLAGQLLGLDHGQTTQEEQRILKGIEPTRENGQKLLDLAQSYTSVNSLPQAIFVYERYLALMPDNVNAWSYLSAVCFQKGDKDKALKAVESALKLDPTHEKTLFNKAVFLLNSEQKEQGLAVLAEIVARNPQAVDPNGAPLSAVIKRLRQQGADGPLR